MYRWQIILPTLPTKEILKEKGCQRKRHATTDVTPLFNKALHLYNSTKEIRQNQIAYIYHSLVAVQRNLTRNCVSNIKYGMVKIQYQLTMTHIYSYFVILRVQIEMLGKHFY